MSRLASNNPTAIVLLSGGIDSACCAHLLTQQGYEVTGLFVDFGQAARKTERVSVQAIAKFLRIGLEVVTVKSQKGFEAGEIIGRNGFLAFTALTHGIKNANIYAMGLHAGTQYYDCSETFVDRIDLIFKESSSGEKTFIAPFEKWSKHEVYEYFFSTDIPIGITYSCEAGQAEPCGICNSCKDRRSIEC